MGKNEVVLTKEELDAIEYINKMNELVTEDNTDYYI
jgi:hypothetical protein